jgi:hypothetical protein
MAQKLHKFRLKKLDKIEAIQIRAMQKAIADARAEVAAKISASARDPKFIGSESVRKTQLAQISKTLGSMEKACQQFMFSGGMATAKLAQQFANDDLKAAGIKSGIVKFDRKRFLETWQMVSPENGPLLAATMVENLNLQVTQGIRQALTDTWRAGEIKGWTLAKRSREIRKAMDGIAGEVSGHKFRDRGGRLWDDRHYTQMLVRTTNARVERDRYLDTLAQNGMDLVIIENVDGDACPVCTAWDNRIVSISGNDSRFPSYSDALGDGWGHPNCRCSAEYADEVADEKEIKDQTFADFPKAKKPKPKPKKKPEPKKKPDPQTEPEPQPAQDEKIDFSKIRDLKELNRAAADKVAFKHAEKAAKKRAAEIAKIHDTSIQGAEAFGNSCTLTGDPVGGSTGAVEMIDGKGQKWIVKFYNGNAAQAQNEFIANRLYAQAGINVPEMRMIRKFGQTGVASKRLTYYVGGKPKDPKVVGVSGLEKAGHAKAVKKGFVADAWLGNWDVAGAGGDNILKVGKTYFRVDQGGALLFRAQGSPKGSAFGSVVDEISTLRNMGKNAQAAKLFGTVTDADIATQIRSLRGAVKSKHIQEIVAQSGIDPKSGQQIRTILNDRLRTLQKLESSLRKLGVAEPQAHVVKGAVVIDNPKKLDAATRTAYHKLTSDERHAMRRLTGGGYGDINGALVSGRVPQLAQQIDTAIDALPKYKGILGRGQGPYMKQQQAQMEKWKTGEWAIWRNKGYTHTSPTPGKEWKKNFKIFFKTTGQRGGYIGAHSQHPSEEEYILPRNFQGRVIGWGENSAKTQAFVYVEEVKDPTKIPLSQPPPPKIEYDEMVRQWKTEWTKAQK